MSPSEFLALADRMLARIEDAVSGAAEANDIDLEASRAGPVLTIECNDGSRAIVNIQEPMQEIWLASRSGGLHFRHEGGRWVDTRGGPDLVAALSIVLTAANGVGIDLAR